MAHLHGFLASASSSAVLLKCGPGKSSGIIGWDRAGDHFQPGQWVRHLIRPEDADLSPDGCYFVHGATTHRRGKQFPGHVVISRPPWLKALALWALPEHFSEVPMTAFVADDSGKLRLFSYLGEAKWNRTPIRVTDRFADYSGYLASGHRISPALYRGGWRRAADPAMLPGEEWTGLGTVNDLTKSRSLEKRLVRGWVLRRTSWTGLAIGRRLGFESFSLKSPGGDICCQTPWEWADWDAARQRLVWTEDCCLFAARFNTKGPGPGRLLFDALDFQFSAVEAPD